MLAECVVNARLIPLTFRRMNLKPVDEIGIKARELVGRKVRSAFRRLIFLTCSPTSDPRELAEGATRLPPYNALYRDSVSVKQPNQTRHNGSMAVSCNEIDSAENTNDGV